LHDAVALLLRTRPRGNGYDEKSRNWWSGKRGQVQFPGTARRVLRRNWTCPPFPSHPKLIDGVASMNGTANLVEYEKFQDAIAKSFSGTKEQVPLEYKKRSAEYRPRKLAMPTGLAVSRKDTIVPPQSVLRLAKKLKELGHKNLKLIHADRGHSTTYEDAMTILEFIIERAGKTGEKETVQQPDRTRLR